MLQTASAKGDLKTATHLELYVANLQIELNQVKETDGATGFERLHGFNSITTADMLQVPHLTEPQLLKILAETKNAKNAEYMRAMHERSKELISFRLQMSDSRAKWQLADRIGKNANKPSLQAGYAVDQQVSIDGEKWQVQRINALPNGDPEAFLVSNAKNQCQWVRADVVRPLSVPVPQHHLPIPPVLTPGNTVFYYDSEYSDRSRILCGDILSVDDDQLTLQVRQPNDTVRTWLPRWTNPTKPNILYRFGYGKQKSGMEPFTDTAPTNSVICIAELTDGSLLTDETIYDLQTHGIDISMAQDPE